MHILQNNFLQLLIEIEGIPIPQYTSVMYSCQLHCGLSFTDLIISLLWYYKALLL